MILRFFLGLLLLGVVTGTYYITYFKIQDYYNIKSLWQEHAHVEEVEGRVVHHAFFWPQMVQVEKNLKLFNNHEIRTLEGKATVNFFDGQVLVEMYPNSKLKIQKTEIEKQEAEGWHGAPREI